VISWGADGDYWDPDERPDEGSTLDQAKVAQLRLPFAPSRPFSRDLVVVHLGQLQPEERVDVSDRYL
jgi:hypothetical protein